MSSRNLPPNSTRFHLDRVFGTFVVPARAETIKERLLETGFWCPRAVKPTSLVCLQDWIGSRPDRLCNP